MPVRPMLRRLSMLAVLQPKSPDDSILVSAVALCQELEENGNSTPAIAKRIAKVTIFTCFCCVGASYRFLRAAVVGITVSKLEINEYTYSPLPLAAYVLPALANTATSAIANMTEPRIMMMLSSVKSF